MRPLFMLLLAFVLPIANKLQAQTLQFSQVLLVSTTQTVPANKVWKVESVMPINQQSIYHQIVVNSTTIIVGTTNYTGSWFNAFPMWLPAGTTLAAGSTVFRVSVIEFTVVP
ncbi:MAG: hypothetical protein FJZ75_07110 [Bacteroidetes bacterium]|nr:hypothetical protein [Bacteroidota bacterium]